eukprot:scaffold33836_cov27-Phaeocystis_antarctica.AAC.1
MAAPSVPALGRAGLATDRYGAPMAAVAGVEARVEAEAEAGPPTVLAPTAPDGTNDATPGGTGTSDAVAGDTDEGTLARLKASIEERHATLTAELAQAKQTLTLTLTLTLALILTLTLIVPLP